MEDFSKIIRQSRLRESRFRIRPYYFEPEETADGCPWKPEDYVPGNLQKRDINEVLTQVPWPHFVRRFLDTSDHDFRLESAFIWVVWKPRRNSSEPIGIIITGEERNLLDWCVNTSGTRCLERNRKVMKTLIWALCRQDPSNIHRC